MANHKRGKAKNQRAGCLLCKPHKANGTKGSAASLDRQGLRAKADEATIEEDSEPPVCDGTCDWCLSQGGGDPDNPYTTHPRYRDDTITEKED